MAAWSVKDPVLYRVIKPMELKRDSASELWQACPTEPDTSPPSQLMTRIAGAACRLASDQRHTLHDVLAELDMQKTAPAAGGPRGRRRQAVVATARPTALHK
jgi:hypothetical protein